MIEPIYILITIAYWGALVLGILIGIAWAKRDRGGEDDWKT